MKEDTVISRHFMFINSLIREHLYLLHAQPFVELSISGLCGWRNMSYLNTQFFQLNDMTEVFHTVSSVPVSGLEM